MWFVVPLVSLVLLVAWFLLNSLFLGIIAVVLVLFSVKIVTPNTVKTVEFLWQFNRVLKPWLNFVIPFIEWTRHQDLFRKNLAIDVDWITSDNVTVYVGLNVVFFVEDDWNDTKNWSIYKSVYSINDPRTLMASTIDEQLRAMVSSFDHKEIFSKREEIGQNIEVNLREKLSQFGYTLDSIQVRNIKLEASVMTAMNKVVESLKLREAALNEWESEKIMQVKRAEADKMAKILIWQWMAGQRMEIAKWFKESVDMIKSSDETLTWDKILKFLLDSSRIETLWNIWNSDKTKLIYLNEDLEWRAMDKEAKLFAWSEMMK